MPTSVRNIKSLFRILPLENQRTSVCSSSCVRSASNYLQRRRNRRKLSGRDLMKLMTLMLQFKMSCSCGLILSWCQRLSVYNTMSPFHVGIFFFSKCNKPFYGAGHRSSSIGVYAATTCPVQTFLREESIYDVKNIFSSGSPLHAFAEQYMLSYAISIAVFHKTNRCALPLTSVDSSKCNANEPVSFATT